MSRGPLGALRLVRPALDLHRALVLPLEAADDEGDRCPLAQIRRALRDVPSVSKTISKSSDTAMPTTALCGAPPGWLELCTA